MTSRNFFFSLPLWFILDRAGLELDDEAGMAIPGQEMNFYTIEGTDAEPCVALFTDEDLAQRFVDETTNEAVVAALDTPEQLVETLAIFARQCPYVAFDASGRVGSVAKWVVPIHDVLKRVQQTIGD
jgi:hypothetical protein